MTKKQRVLSTAALLISFLALIVIQASATGSVGQIWGGGQIHEAPDGAKRPLWNVISFGGGIITDASGNVTSGDWQVNFHNVGNDDLDQGKFHSTNNGLVNFYEGDYKTCYAAFNFLSVGTWNGEPGYSMMFRGGDFGSPGFVDTVRVELYGPNGKVYDTYPIEFTPESSCVGGARTGLDAGNITIVRP